MASVLISLGSNTRQAAHIHWASQRLSTLLCGVRFSRTLWTPDVRGTGVMYMNSLAVGTTDLSVEALQQQLKAIEAETGRSEKGVVTLDLDLLAYDKERYHDKDWQRPYVRNLLSDVLPF